MHIIFVVLSTTLIYGVIDVHGYRNLDTLGEEISASVQRQLQPLENLGERINQNVQAQMARVNQDVYAQMAPLQNLGPRISASVKSSLSGLDNLGEQIQQSVYQNLEPVRALEFIFKMQDGVGGTTVATYSPNGKTVVIKNKQRYICKGELSNKTGKCSGDLTPFVQNDKSDFCYASGGHTVINNIICLANGPTSVSMINNQFSCRSVDGSPVLVLNLEEYNRLCSGLARGVKYTYYSDLNDPRHVQIPHPNKSVKCENNEPGVCVFRKDLTYFF
ncbi:unnamed protein product [Brassicogethes aeneus]|uniref:Uncharacterized protein n=1 Tax=Brassicogethes aeneus TaxID=1431903 RepID=A0A9P0AZ20_BRAAE|nr:unnamed protein product [Brassicogethes aeneus]